MSNLPVVIFQFALSPYADWQKLAWAGALVITVTVLVLIDPGARTCKTKGSAMSSYVMDAPAAHVTGKTRCAGKNIDPRT